MRNQLNRQFVRVMKLFTPPILWKILKKIVSIQDRQDTFEGVFEHIKQVDATGYDSAKSLNETYEFTNKKFAHYLAEEKLPGSSPLSPIANLLPLLIASLAQKKQAISVLDFGGGMGSSYIDCIHSLSALNIELEYHIVDLSSTVELGKKIFPSSYNVHFYSDIPSNIQTIDVVYLGSSLQYVSEYQSTIHLLMRLDPKYVLITDNFMGKAPTFATAQVNMKDRRMAYWIFQLDEIIKLITQHNFTLIYKSVNYQPFHHFENFPDRYRVQNTCNLLFLRKECGEPEIIEKKNMFAARGSQRLVFS